MRELVVGVVALASLPTSGFAETSRTIDAFVTASPFAAFDMPADGHGPSEKAIVEAGLGVDLSWRLARHFAVSLGLRYDAGFGREDTGHFFAAPVTAHLVIPLAGHRQWFSIDTALGLGAGLVGDLLAVGPAGELGLSYHRPLADHWGAFLRAGVRLEVLREQNAAGDSYLAGADLVHVQLPFIRIGLTWGQREPVRPRAQ